jgi:hypothetical protein
MTIQTSIAALQTLHAAVTGVTAAPTAYPSSLDTAGLPCILVLPTEGTVDLESFAAKKRGDDIYRVYVYVAPVSQGAGTNEGVQLAIDLMQRLRDLYVTAANVALTSGTYQATLKVSSGDPVRHSPIGTLDFGGVAYRGFTFDVGVMEKW